VPPSSNRDDVVSAIRDFGIDARTINADLLMIATTRPQGYGKEFSPRRYRHAWLKPLTDERALEYASRLVEVRYARDRDRHDRVSERINRAIGHSATRHLMRTPLQVTILTILVDRMGEPPQERWQLFNEYYRVIFQREAERELPTSKVLRDHRIQVDAIHRRAGLVLQLRSERAGETHARLTPDEFAEIVRSRLSDEGHPQAEAENLEAQITTAATQRLVFLSGVEEGAIGFEIRSLQEFMAAEAMLDAADTDAQARLREIAALSGWRNVFLFAVGKCFTEREHLRDSIHAICVELNEGVHDPVHRITLAGATLALELIEDGAVLLPKYTQLFTRQALGVLDLDGTQYAVRLAGCFTEGQRELFEEELTARLGGDHALPSWICLSALADAGWAWANELGERLWPPKGDLRAFARVVDLHRPDGWLSRRLIPLIPTWPASALPRIGLRFSQREIAERSPPSLRAVLSVLAPGSQNVGSIVAPLVGWPDLVLVIPGRVAKRKSASSSFLSDLPTAHAEWRVMRAVGEFRATPSTESLAGALKVISDEGWQTLEAMQLPMMRVPWPLRAVLNAANGDVDLAQFSRTADEAGFGTLDDWTAAEERLSKDGVQVEDLDATLAEWPLGAAIGSRGVPVTAATALRRSSLPHDVLASAAPEFYRSLAPSRLRSEVGRVLLFSARRIDMHMDDAMTPLTVSDAVALQHDLEDQRLVASALRWVDGSEDQPTYLQLLETLGEAGALAVFPGIPAQAGVLARDTLQVEPARKWLLPAIAASGVAAPRIVETIDYAALGDPKLEAAYLALDLNGLTGDSELSDELRERIGALPTQEARMLIFSARHGQFRERTAVRLLARFASDSGHPSVRAFAANALAERLLRRRSNLAEPAVWAALNFPDSLRGAIPA